MTALATAGLAYTFEQIGKNPTSINSSYRWILHRWQRHRSDSHEAVHISPDDPDRRLTGHRTSELRDR